MNDLTEAARRALGALGGAPEAHGAPAEAGDVRVERLSLEVVAEGRAEIVTVALRGADLLCISSDGRTDGPHVLAALRLLAGPGAGAANDVASSGSEAPDRRVAPPANAARIAAHLDDVVTAVARVGAASAAGAPSVEEAIERLVAASKPAVPIDLARFVGRLREAFARRDGDRVARLLDGASRVAAGLRGAPDADRAPGTPHPLASYASPAAFGERVHARRLVEVGREWLAGLTRAEIQRRYLVDVDSGAAYREERHRDAVASLGPCPRTLTMGLATSSAGPPPTPVRLLQYEVEPRIDADGYRALEGHAERDVAALTERYRHAQRSFPGLAEPFALIAPARVELAPRLQLVDERGHVLPIARAEEPAAATVLERACAGALPRWVAGRLVDDAGVLLLVPVAAAFAAGTDTTHLRLT